MKMTLRKKILLCALLPICILGAIVIIIASTIVRNSIIEQVEKSLHGTAVATLAAYDQNAGAYLEASNGDIWKGSYNISQSQNLVDMIKEKSGVDVTFFYGNRRIMTSAFNKDNERILGSPAGEKVTQEVLVNGNDYFSSYVSIDGTIYYGYYIPVYQMGDDETPIGMVFAGVNKADTLAGVNQIIATIIFIVVLVMVVCVAVVSIIASSITRALKKSIRNVQEVSAGKLTVEVDQKYLRKKDEVGDLARSIESLQKELRSMIGSISDSADELKNASDMLEKTSHKTAENIRQVKGAMNSITSGAMNQAEDTQNASENIGHMGSLITGTGKEADELSKSSDKMKSSSDQATESIALLKEISEEVRTAVEEIAQQTYQTNESAQRIKEASDFISDIAAETNLLSLNATIEAARAGEAGRGFAVVASQIQKLAEQANDASGSIDEIVNALMNQSGMVVETMTHMQEVIEKQNHHISDTGETVGRVMDEIGSSVESIKSIDQRVKELEHSRIDIVETIDTLSGIAQDNVAETQEADAIITEVAQNIGEVEKSAQDLRSMAELLAQNVGNFEL